MAPLDRFTYSPVVSESYVTYHETGSDKPHQQHQWEQGDYFILSQRDVIVGTNPLSEFVDAPRSQTTTTNPRQGPPPSSAPFNTFAALVDLFTENLCLCPSQHRTNNNRSQQPYYAQSSCGDMFRAAPTSTRDSTTTVPSTANSMRKNNIIVYPVARYPDRLNSPELVQQRRKSLQEFSTFRPLVVGE